MSPAKAKVILVDDIRNLREESKDALGRAGHTVLFDASDLATALQKLGELKETPDVALIDGTFPKKSGQSESTYAGADFASALEKKFPTTVRVFFSTSNEGRFGKYKFPESGKIKNEDTIRNELGRFVTQLPPQTRK